MSVTTIAAKITAATMQTMTSVVLDMDLKYPL